MLFKMAGARAHHKKKRKHDVMRAWQEYVEVRRRKRHISGVAMELHLHNLKRKAWCSWCSRVMEACQVARLEEEVLVRGAIARLRRGLKAWTFCILQHHIWK